MEKVLLQEAIKLNKERKHRKWWHQLVRALAGVVIFCTTYALILPAITMTRNPECGLENHIHEAACYESVGVSELQCDLDLEETDIVLHIHDKLCYDADGALVCTLQERCNHTHTDSCYEDPVRICNLAEAPGHVHGEGCSGEPALTCSIAETSGHTHGENCVFEQLLVCNLAEEPGHTHGEDCVFQSILTCERPENETHTHSDACYTLSLECSLTPAEGHTHGEACYQLTERCQIPESAGHVHNESCYEAGEACQLPESAGHTHTEGCYEQAALVCTEEVLQLHIHGNECFNEMGALVCRLPQVVEHQHRENCFVACQKDVLICQLPEHEHTDACYPVEQTQPAEVSPWICGSGAHTHSKNCVDETGALVCTIPEHTHDPSCMGIEYDPNADVETAQQWEKVAQELALTGRHPEDLLLVAKAQLDYTQSTKNCILDGEQLRYYTRYGAKYDDPYGAWNTMFAMFCIDYAQVKDFPTDKDPEKWMEKLAEAQCLEDLEVYTPKPGDILFIEPDRTKETPADVPIKVQAVALVAQITEEHTVTIQGDVDGAVAAVTYDRDDPRLIAAGNLPEGKRMLIGEGEDYTVIVTFDDAAQIPQTAALDVREILPGTEEYDNYYMQSLQSLQTMAEQTEQPEQAVVFARFFDIQFLVDGQKIEPAAPVDIRITYHQGLETDDTQKGVAVHFAQEGVEVLDAQVTQSESKTDTFSFTQDSFSVSGTMLLADARAKANYHIWLDGTLGGVMTYAGSDNKYYNPKHGEAFTLPQTWKSPSKYSFTLRGWYDIVAGTYHQPGETIIIDHDAVFYADWTASTYNIGQDNNHVVNAMDTREFVTMEMFDYNALFNLLAVEYSGTISGTSHSETWKQTADGLGFLFRDWDNGNKDITYPSNMTTTNSNWENVIKGLAGNIGDDISQSRLMEMLFGQTPVIGKEKVGNGNYLFQYMTNPESDYYGYYYYDSALNATSYNQSQQRFFVYDYLERTSDHSEGNSDFLPLNSVYANTNGKTVSVDSDGTYVFDAKDSGNNPITNYHFGLKTNIHFYLPNDTGQAVDDYGNMGNLDTNGNPMIFSFEGDDDLWVFIDGKLVLDVGGIHGARSGTINFSTGEVRNDGTYSHSFNLSEGGHDLTIYYLERGSSLSNCAIYFNLAPRYGLELEKQDFLTREAVNGVVFSVYTDAACTVPAKLWNSHIDAKEDKPSTNNFTVQDGYLYMWGLVAGKTYYIRENSDLTPENVKQVYLLSDDLLRVTLNDHGSDVSELTILRGSDGERTSGFEVVAHTLNEETQTVHVTVTNPRIPDEESRSKKVKVFKRWADGSSNLPKTITVRLLANGEQFGANANLSGDNGWVYTWSGLPPEDENGPIVYDVEELAVPGFQSSVTERVATEDITDWLKVAALEDGETYMILTGGNALALSNGSLTTVTQEQAKENPAAQWKVLAHNDGYRIFNGSYTLTLENDSRYIVTTGTGNQTLYFDGTRLFAMYNQNRYYLGTVSGGKAEASTSAQTVQLHKYELTTRDVQQFIVENTPIPKDQQISLKVNKQWDTENNVSGINVVVRLFADGEDTGRTVTLNKSNKWTATFEGLDKAFTYSVRENSIPGYTPFYSEMTPMTAVDVQWQTQSSLTAGKVYCFTANGRALADTGNSISATTVDLDNISDDQQWEAVKSGTSIRLRNVGTKRYLSVRSSGVTGTTSSTSATNAKLQNGLLNMNNRYLRFQNSSVSSDTRTNNATTFVTYQETEVQVNVGYEVTITNTYSGAELPKTGGQGPPIFYAFGTVFLITAALMYLYPFGRKRREEGGKPPGS